MTKPPKASKSKSGPPVAKVPHEWSKDALFAKAQRYVEEMLEHRAITGSQWLSAYIEPAITAVRSAKSADYIVRIFSFETFEPVSHLKRDVLRVDSFRPSPANDVAKRCSKIF